MAEWTRKEHTTKGYDPTVVVAWSGRGITLTEFQQVVVLEKDGFGMGVLHRERLLSLVQQLAEELHAALERAHTAEREVQLALQEAREEVEAAERAAGWDPNP